MPSQTGTEARTVAIPALIGHNSTLHSEGGFMRWLLLLTLIFIPVLASAAEPKVFAQENLTAWCIVPFDGKKRGPEERVAMLKRLGFTRYAYDWRAEHLPTFGKEIELLKHEKIALQGVWFPAGVGKDGQTILDLLQTHKIETELWVMLPQPDAKLAQADKVKTTAAFLGALAKKVAGQGCKIGVYNHGGWAGEPENMVAVMKACGEPNVGIIYNLHHGHDHLAKFDEYLKSMKPHLYSISLNGMEKDGDKKGKKLLVISDGPEDRTVLKTIVASGYAGPLNILGHTDDDVEERLTDNLTGLAHAVKHLDAKTLPKSGFLTPTANSLQIRIAAPKAGAPLAFIASNFPEAARINMPLATDFAKTGFVVSVDRDGAGPIEGKGVIADGRLVFTPRLPPTPGVSYRVVIDRAPLGDAKPDPAARAVVTFRKVPPTKSTEVEKLYPTGDLLPENTLRLYIQFTAPMTRGNAYKYLQLLKDDGKSVYLPFLELDEELWSRDGKRLTVLFDPGRVKRGLKPREEDGPIFEEGKKYTLVIDKAWEDETGFPLKDSLTKAFSVTKPDDAPVDPQKWTVIGPADKGSALKVSFEKPLDRALAERMLSVRGADDKPVSMVVSVNATQTGVEILPASKLWVAGKYQLVVDKRLEDVCGNRVGRAFELDVLRPVTKVPEVGTVELPFAVR